MQQILGAAFAPSKDSLVGTITHTKTTIGSRLLRTNLMSPPTRADAGDARLQLVELFLGNEEFFYAVLEHLGSLLDVDKMLSNIALVPCKAAKLGRDDERGSISEWVTSKGILVPICIELTLQALPIFLGVLQSHLQAVDSRSTSGDDGETVMTKRSSLLLSLGGGSPILPN